MKTLLTTLIVATLGVAVWATPERQAQFDAATLKLSAPNLSGAPININLGTSRNGTITLTNATLSDCLQYAYGIVSDVQIAGPDWIKGRSDTRYDVVAKAAADTPQGQLLIMLQNLLAERLKVKLHHEKRDLPFLALIVAKGGAKLAPSTESTSPVSTALGRISHPHMNMALLATLISRFERQLTLDLTGLSEYYKINLQWTPEAFKSRAPADGSPLLINGQAVDLNGATIYTALQEQLGLRLESRKGPVDVLVVDSAEKNPLD